MPRAKPSLRLAPRDRAVHSKPQASATGARASPTYLLAGLAPVQPHEILLGLYTSVFSVPRFHIHAVPSVCNM